MGNERYRLDRNVRIIFFGHSGLGKSTVLQRLADYTQEQLSGVDCRTIASDRIVKVYDAQSYIPMAAFLSASPLHKADYLNQSLTRVLEDINEEDPPVAFLSLHLTYFHNTAFSSLTGIPISHEESPVRKLREQFRPDLCFTLIGDIYHAWSKIPQTYGITLRDLLVWRNIEMVQADDIARQIIDHGGADLTSNPYEFSPIVSVMQPPSTIYRYIFEPETLRIYASFPISKPRRNEKSRREIDEFRDALHQRFVVFDPLTIDELPLERIYQKAQPTDEKIDLPEELLWRLPKGWAMSPVPRSTIRGLPRRQLQEIVEAQDEGLRTPLRQQVEERDYRLIDQADCVVLYRPQFGGADNYSQGTEAEMWYAQHHVKSRILIHDPADGNMPDRMFRPIPTPYRFVRSNLSKPSVRSKVLKEVIEFLQANGHRLSAMRVRRQSPLALSNEND